MPKHHKIVLFFTVIIPKFAINISHIIISLIFISTAGSINDIVMNCLAVVFVTDLDDMIFAIMANKTSADYIDAFPQTNLSEKGTKFTRILIPCKLFYVFIAVVIN